MSAAIETQLQFYEGAGGVRLAADVGGPVSSDAVVLLHGGGQTRHSWRRAVRALLDDGYHVINLDARGHGDSDWAPDADYSLDAFSSDLERVIQTLPSAPTLVGASLGGITSLNVLGRNPALASNLILVDIVPHINPPGRERIRAFMASHTNGFASVDDALRAVQAYNPARQAGSTAGLMKNLRLRDDGRLYWHWDPNLLTDMKRIDPPDRAAALDTAASRVKVPTLLVRGRRSDVVTDDGVAKLKARIPQLEVCNVKDASHMVAGDENDLFNQAILSFMYGHRRR